MPVAGIGMENRGMVYIIIDENYSSDYTSASWVPQSWVNVRIEVSASAVKYYLDNTLIYTPNNFSQLNIEGFNMLHNNYGEDAYYDNMCYYNGSLSANQMELVEVKLYPNPAVNELKINTPKGIVINSLKIFDLSGKQILHSKASIGVDILSLSQGTYFVKINTIRGSIGKKIIKN
ncbi:T9SS type A sorting domain-containing protein [Mesonia sp. HuA40]|uniref:T9SS type A sorting domain-containing protein n=1 Tax=Mesonia sp. HuA40 TaxID=2602761 RepID=UPI0011CB5B38|nr:T9SS type A sorting domain-containing protein [Mesonia sp. HuA40]TXK70607.1 T9SS type A sorting domain-containing protein [Mesonia sp. HuA40]